MHRPAQRLTRVIARAAVVPVVLVASGCSLLSGSDDGDKDGGDASSSPSAPATTAAPPAFAKLPKPCETLSKKTLDDLVPKAGSGSVGKSDDTSLRGSCSWDSLDNNGVHGSQFRWLNVSLARFAAEPGRDAPNTLASRYYDKQVSAAKAAEGATGVRTEPAEGTGGDQATAVRYDLKKKEGRFKQQTVVVRKDNVVVTVDYDGAGLAGEKTPDADDLMKDAKRAAKEALAAVTEANKSGGSGDAGGSDGD